MGLRLYHSPLSPYVRKVMVVLHETGRAGQVELIPGSGTPVDSGNSPVGLNPLGKIPALERDDGPALYDSRVICRYLAEGAKPALYPEGRALWDSLVLEATGDGIMDAALLIVYEARLRPEELRFAPWVEGQWQKVARALDMLESRWMAHLYGPLDIGQIAVGCALGYLDLRHSGRDWREGRASLAAWFARVSDRESFRATAPQG